MSLSPAKFKRIELAARAARAISQFRQMAYAQLAPDLTVTQVSPNFSALLPDLAEEIIGQPIADLLWEFVGAEETLGDILRGDAPVFRLEQVSRGGAPSAPIYLSFQVAPLDENQPGRGLLLLVEDGSEYGRLQQSLVQDRNELRLLQRQLTQANEELHDLNRLKSLFLSMSAHDLRTPLASVSGYASLILDRIPEGTPPKIRQYLEIVLSQSDRMNRLISDFLDLDQIEQGCLAIKPEACDLNEIIGDVTAVMKINADSRQIVMETNLPNPPLRLWVDREKLFRIIYNLVGNAVKYTQRGGRVWVRVKQEEAEVAIQIADNGPGMTAEQVSQLFQLYYRTDDARRSKTKGTGLGLYIVKALTEAHQGRIQVASQPGQGSTFTVYLPLQTSSRT
ncbi:MAG: hypothetical protein GY803_01715 [Chloroflexi bacterium]|nr:hypothetical protein [Chloroflexota bacterium]